MVGAGKGKWIQVKVRYDNLFKNHFPHCNPTVSGFGE